MKKLMIAAAIVCAAAFAQAASHSWNFASNGAIVDGYNATAVGGTSENAIGKDVVAYLIYAGGSFGEGYEGNLGISQADLLKALREGKTVTKAAGDNLLATSKTGTDSKVI